MKFAVLKTFAPFYILVAALLAVLPSSAQVLSTNLETKILNASDGSSMDEFGISVSVSGTTVAVGAPMDDEAGQNSRSGAVFVYEKDFGGADQWGEVKKLTPSNAEPGDQFGQSVSLEGDTMVIGAYQAPTTLSGKAYIFERDQGGPNQWGEVTELVVTNIFAGDRFGWSVALSGDTVAVGAPRRNGFVSNVGSVFIFERNKGGTNEWGLVKDIMPFEGGMNLNFGESISLQGDRLAVGAVGEFSLSGAVYIYERNQGGTNEWGFVKQLMADDFFLNDQFGKSVSLEGDTIAVGAHLDDTDDGGVNSGSVYIFEKDLGGEGMWGQLQHLVMPASEGARMGSSVRLYEDELIVGAPRADSSVSGSGIALQYKLVEGETNRWDLTGYFAGTNLQDGDEFGFSLAINEDWIIVGSPHSQGNEPGAGGAYVFTREIIPPVMSFELVGDMLQISWEPPTPGFFLQGAPVLDSLSWTNTSSGGANPVMVPFSGSQGYFRLIRP